MNRGNEEQTPQKSGFCGKRRSTLQMRRKMGKSLGDSLKRLWLWLLLLQQQRVRLDMQMR
jgi:hypothetical protein